MASFTIDQAFTYFRYKDTKADEFQDALTAALPDAESQFQQAFPAQYIRFKNIPDNGLIPITAKTGDGESWVIEYDDTYFGVSIGEYIQVGAYLFLVTDIDDGTLTITTKATITATEFTIQSYSNYENLFAWMLVYTTTFTAEEMIIDIIKADNKEFGEGEIRPYWNSLQSYRKQLNRNIDNAKKSVSVSSSSGSVFQGIRN